MAPSKRGIQVHTTERWVSYTKDLHVRNKFSTDPLLSHIIMETIKFSKKKKQRREECATATRKLILQFLTSDTDFLPLFLFNSFIFFLSWMHITILLHIHYFIYSLSQFNRTAATSAEHLERKSSLSLFDAIPHIYYMCMAIRRDEEEESN